jgi:hypothetical protein
MINTRSLEALYAPNSKYQIAVVAPASRRRVCAAWRLVKRQARGRRHENAATLDKRAQSKESWRSESNSVSISGRGHTQ